MEYRIYDPEKDKDAVHRIWREIGWVEDEEGEKAMDLFLDGARVLVKDIDGEPECLVAAVPGDIRYQDETLPIQIVAAVTTSRIARKQGFAGRMTAHLIAVDAAEGAALSTLGIFEQGFYNRLGYGNGSYENLVRFDPANLKVDGPSRPPKRITVDDVEQVLKATHNRRRVHGSINIHPLSAMRGELSWKKELFGLGYYAEDGETLTHFLWANPKGEHGPYRISMFVYQNREQFLELMGVVKSLGDQVHMVAMREPTDVQLQDLIKAPFRHYSTTNNSDFEADNQSYAYWQMRICDLQTCIDATHLRTDPVRFNLALHDPIEKYLSEDAPWHGISGEYIISFGKESSVEVGSDASLPTLTAGVGAFTRMWLGVRPASGLAMTDELAGPDELLAALDKAFMLPTPHPDWEY